MAIKIDNEFKSLLQPLSEEEREQLKNNLITDGCREPLVLWGEIIVDGHNRFEICNANGVSYKTVQKDFADRQAAMDWIDKNQLGRRNLTPNQLSLIRGRMHERRKQVKGEYQSKGAKITPLATGRTRDILSTELGVSPKTIMHDAEFAKAVDILPEVKEKIQKGEKVVRSHVIAAAKAKNDGDEEQAEKILSGQHRQPVQIETPDNTTDKIKLIFEQAKIFDKWEKTLKDLDCEINNAIKTNPATAFLFPTFYKTHMTSLRRYLKNARPSEVCTHCNGDGCEECNKTGFITAIETKIQKKDEKDGTGNV